MKILKRPLFLFLIGFLPGLAIFFPYRILTSQIESELRTRARVEVRLGDLHLGTGLGLGLGRGGVAALKGRNVNLTLPGGRGLTCQELVLSPHMWSVLIAQLRVTVACRTERQGTIVSVAKLSPLWGPTDLAATVDLEEVKLSLLDSLFGIPNVGGTIDGRLELGLPLASRGLPTLAWEAEATKLMTPAVAAGFVNFPNISLGTLHARGKLASGGKGEIEELRFGDKSSPLEGLLQGSFALSPQGFPTSADLRGRLRSDPQFERDQLKDINLDLMFGKANSSGFREFRKRAADGNLFGLLMGPPDAT